MSDEEAMTAVAKRSTEAYLRNVRYRAIVQGIVARAMKEHGPVDPECADRDACDIATKVAALLLQTIYENDAELNAQKELAERYRKIAEDAVATMPPPFFIKTPK